MKIKDGFRATAWATDRTEVEPLMEAARSR